MPVLSEGPEAQIEFLRGLGVKDLVPVLDSYGNARGDRGKIKSKVEMPASVICVMCVLISIAATGCASAPQLHHCISIVTVSYLDDSTI